MDFYTFPVGVPGTFGNYCSTLECYIYVLATSRTDYGKPVICELPDVPILYKSCRDCRDLLAFKKLLECSDLQRNPCFNFQQFVKRAFENATSST